jgi:hypothetical protein
MGTSAQDAPRDTITGLSINNVGHLIETFPGKMYQFPIWGRNFSFTGDEMCIPKFQTALIFQSRKILKSKQIKIKDP